MLVKQRTCLLLLLLLLLLPLLLLLLRPLPLQLPHLLLQQTLQQLQRPPFHR
jgi:hypothetical protein